MSDESNDPMEFLRPTIIGWQIIEKACDDFGVVGAHDPMFKSKAEHLAKAIVSRLAAHDPPIFLEFGKDE